MQQPPASYRCSPLELHSVTGFKPVTGCVQVSGKQLKLEYPMPKLRKGLCRSMSCSVNLRLEPLGAHVRITSVSQLRSLVSSLLTTLGQIHQHGFVHRDVRLDTVIRATTGWLLIDWALAGRTSEQIKWYGGRGNCCQMG